MADSLQPRVAYMTPKKYLFIFKIENVVKYRGPNLRVTWSESHSDDLKRFEFLRQFSKKQDMIKKKYQLNRNEKFVDKAQQCFAFLHIKPKFKFAVQWSWFLET